jgi:large subunit ribosomal protein L11
MKKIDGYVKLQVPAGQANPSPPIGPALGQRGLNIMEFCKQFNAATQGAGAGHADPGDHHRTTRPQLHFRDEDAAASYYIKKAAGIESGSKTRARPAPAR